MEEKNINRLLTIEERKDLVGVIINEAFDCKTKYEALIGEMESRKYQLSTSEEQKKKDAQKLEELLQRKELLEISVRMYQAHYERQREKEALFENREGEGVWMQ